jgi:hypothetical protein
MIELQNEKHRNELQAKEIEILNYKLLQSSTAKQRNTK